MITLDKKQAIEKWDIWWNQLRHDWFKVEVLQDYSGEDNGPSLAAWKKGERELSLMLLREQNNLELPERQVNKIRVHIVQEPYSEYLNWEIEHYKIINISINDEKVFLLDKGRIKGLNIPDGDFCIFDERRVIKNYYNEDGFCTHMDFYDTGEDITYFLNLKNKLLQLALPIQ